MRITYASLLKIGALLLLFVWWHQYYFTYTDHRYGCDISIRPSLFELSNGNIKEALLALKYASPQGYRETCKNVRIIHPNMSCGGWQGGCYYGKEGEIYLSTTNDEFLAWTAAATVHEACHNAQKTEGRPYSEDECYRRSHEILVELVQYTDP